MTPLDYTLECDGERVYCAGPGRVITELARCDGAVRLAGSAYHVSLPATLDNLLACEAVAEPTRVTADYRRARAAAVAADLPAVAYEAARATYGGRLLEHQVQFLARAVSAPDYSCMNGSSQGTGKTRAAWALCHAVAARRVLVILPKPLYGEWVNELRELLAGDATSPYELVDLTCGRVDERSRRVASLYKDPRHLALFVNYEVLHELVRFLLRFKPEVVFYDESYFLKNPSAKRTRAALKLARVARVNVPMTGTAVGRHVGDLWSQLRLVDPELLPPTYGEFIQEYAVQVPVSLANRVVQKIVGCRNSAELVRRIRPRWWRVTKETCAQLPEKRYHRAEVSLTVEQRAFYGRVAELGEPALGRELSLAGEGVTQLRLQQVTGGWVPVLDATGRESLTQVTTAKLDWLREFAATRLLPDPAVRCLVWCRFRAEVTHLMAALNEVLGPGRAVAVMGGEPATDTALTTVKAGFQSRDEDGPQVLVCQWARMCSGHNLQAADWHVRYSFTWDYIQWSQAEDRSHRIGRLTPVNYVDLVVPNTIDDEILSALRDRRSLATRLQPELFVENC